MSMSKKIINSPPRHVLDRMNKKFLASLKEDFPVYREPSKKSIEERKKKAAMKKKK